MSLTPNAIDFAQLAVSEFKEGKGQAFIRFADLLHESKRFRLTLPPLSAPFGLSEFKGKNSLPLDLDSETERFFDALDQRMIQIAYNNRVELWGAAADAWSLPVVEFKYTSSVKRDKEMRYRPKIKPSISRDMGVESGAQEIQCVVEPSVWKSSTGFGVRLRVVFVASVKHVNGSSRAGGPTGKCYL